MSKFGALGSSFYSSPLIVCLVACFRLLIHTVCSRLHVMLPLRMTLKKRKLMMMMLVTTSRVMMPCYQLLTIQVSSQSHILLALLHHPNATFVIFPLTSHPCLPRSRHISLHSTRSRTHCLPHHLAPPQVTIVFSQNEKPAHHCSWMKATFSCSEQIIRLMYNGKKQWNDEKDALEI